MGKQISLIVQHCNKCPYFLYISSKSKYNFTGCFCEKSERQIMTVEDFELNNVVCDIPSWCILDNV